ncbi:MAG: glycosyltransferase [Gammaproteobacteria bacterium]|nr:glycosyltransferase [Gammaproteobacteria bacterium]
MSTGQGAGRTEAPVTLKLHQELPAEIEVGSGQFLVLSGECLAPGDKVEMVLVEVDGVGEAAELSRIPGGVAFWHPVFLPGKLVGCTIQLDVSLRLRADGTHKRPLGTIACRGVNWRPVDAAGTRGGGLVAICMATYEPELDAFRRQIDSIRDQTHGAWFCIVNDDGSGDETWARMQACCAGDSRFVFFRNAKNLGFYGNFESALKKVPDNADYVAFSDQDDRWYPDKLTRLVRKLREDDANLAYSDVRIVDETGREVAGTYWVNRRNEYRDLKVVLIANTVTGAASVFKRELLEYLLPFPPRVGDAFHDHWLACTAMSMGRITYVDAPLHDYYQHGASVIGHCDFVRFTLGQRIASLLRFCVRLCRPGVAGPLLRAKYGSALAVYRGECRRLRLLQETIRRRCPVAAERRRDLRLFDGGIRSVVRLLVLHARVLWKGQTTDDAEIRLAMGEAARIVERRRG